jgi:oligopeptide transport system substrate-binding protein
MKNIIVLIILFLISTGCLKKEDAQDSRTLRVALSQEISSLDPVTSYDNISGSIVYNVYEQLFEYHYLIRPYELRPLLAEKMPTIENGGKRYIIKIKNNIRYHDHPAFKGQARLVKADDFVTAFKRLAFTPLNSSGWWILDGSIVGANEFKNAVGDDFNKFKSTPIKGVSAPDDSTLVIDLIQPKSQFIYKLAMSFTSPIPLEVLEYEKNKLNTIEVGTGPFKIASANLAKEIVLTKNTNYHESFYPSEGDRYANNRSLLKDAGEKLPFIDRVNYKIITDSNERFERFLNKEFDMLQLPQEFYNQVFDELGNLKENIKARNIRLQTYPTQTYWWLSFNMKDPLLGKNLNLRKAIAHALDINQYVTETNSSTGQVANSILPPGIVGYNPATTLPYKFNLALAKEYLAKAGYPNGKNLPIITYDTRSTATRASRKQAEMIQSQLATIGIKININYNNFSQFLEKSRRGNLQFFQDGWTLDYPDAENVYQLLLSSNKAPGPNSSFYNNKDFDKMYEQISRLPEGPIRLKLLAQMEEQVNQDLPWVMQYYAREFILHFDHVKNYRPSDLVWNYPKYLRLTR